MDEPVPQDISTEEKQQAAAYSLEKRIQKAREANLAFYLDDPSAESANLLVIFERTVTVLRGEAKLKRLSQ